MPVDRPFDQVAVLVREDEFLLLHPRSGGLDQERIRGLDFPSRQQSGGSGGRDDTSR